MNHKEKAISLFMEGYNCAQAVTAAFSDVMGLTEKEALRLSSAFGGGIGRTRETCGAVSAMALVLSAAEGYDEPDANKRTVLYAHTQELLCAFKARCRSFVCRELLSAGDEPLSPVPTARTAEFYLKRPCVHLIETAAQILDDYFEKRNDE